MTIVNLTTEENGSFRATLRREPQRRLECIDIDLFFDWLYTGREDVLKFRKEAIGTHGSKALKLLTKFAILNNWCRIKRSVYCGTEEPDSDHVFTRAEKIGTLGVLALIGSCVALTGNSMPIAAMAVTPVVAKDAEVIPVPVVKASPQLPKLTSRPEVGVYIDLNYRYPHLRMATGPVTSTTATFSAFHGKWIGKGLYSRYLGVREEIPHAAVTDANTFHNYMFRLKYASNNDVTPSARKMEGQYAEMYNIQRTHMTLRQFVQGVDMVIKESVTSINWNGLCADSKLKLDGEQCALVQTLAGQITAEEQVAYAITELLANDQNNHGVYNAFVIDMGLRNFGREFFDLVPAQGDGLASGGLWQFTCYAVGAYDRLDKKTGRMVPEIAPVTVVSRHATIKVPESFLNFKRTDHERASIYFRVNNLAFLVRDAAKNKKAYETLERVAKGGRELDMLTFTATSHHAHNKVRTDFAIPWLKDGARKPFASYLRGRFVEYGIKTRINFPGLKAYLQNDKLAGLSIKKGVPS